jgi:hypothetical protein
MWRSGLDVKVVHRLALRMVGRLRRHRLRLRAGQVCGIRTVEEGELGGFVRARNRKSLMRWIQRLQTMRRSLRLV